LTITTIARRATAAAGGRPLGMAATARAAIPCR
jgi:hypothetical protein